jgi:hypothetical protein
MEKTIKYALKEAYNNGYQDGLKVLRNAEKRFEEILKQVRNDSN